MIPKYTSILFCFHPGHTDVYKDGAPIGVISQDLFSLHHNVNAKGERGPVEIPIYDLYAVKDAIKIIEGKP